MPLRAILCSPEPLGTGDQVPVQVHARTTGSVLRSCLVAAIAVPTTGDRTVRNRWHRPRHEIRPTVGGGSSAVACQCYGRPVPTMTRTRGVVTNPSRTCADRLSAARHGALGTVPACRSAATALRAFAECPASAWCAPLASTIALNTECARPASATARHPIGALTAPWAADPFQGHAARNGRVCLCTSCRRG